MRRLRRILTLAAAIVLITLPAFAQSAVRAEFACATTHRFEGFGLNIMPLKEPTALLGLMQDLRVKLVRWALPPNTVAIDVPDGLSFDPLVDFLDHANREAERRSRIEPLPFYRKLQEMGLLQVAASWAFPANWKTHQPGPKGQPNRHLSDDRVEDYARLLAANLVLLKRNGVVPYAIELLNEPVNRLSPLRHAELARHFLAWRQQLGLTTRLAGPATVFPAEVPRYLREMATQSTTVDIITTHVWDSFKTRQIASLDPLTAGIPPGQRRPIFVTEYGIDEDRWYHPPYTSGPHDRPGVRNAVEDTPFAVATAAQTLALLGSGADAVLYWQAHDMPWDKQQWALVKANGERRPAVDALRALFRPLQPGDKIVSWQDRGRVLPAALFVSAGRYTLEIANESPKPQQYDLTLRDCPGAPLVPAGIETWPAGRSVQIDHPTTGLQLTIPSNTMAVVALHGQ